ncbi:MAG: efflux RND transporter periplasmic adaptor subunit [Herminiimonas sp.]|nr:efflux RND transporter periplasmic adaptor subunit [Herminiimonas sp.]
MHQPHAPRRRRCAMVGFVPMTLLALVLASCSKPVEKAEDIRPVRVQKVALDQAEILAEFPGDVRARVESKLGFRVGGKVVARKVNIGDVVKRGQILMQLDPQDLRLAQVQANAGLQAARSNAELARAELKRYQDLRDKNFVSQAVLDGKITADRASRASYEQAAAAYKGQTNQAGYAVLVADVEGVVTGVDAEVGQVVAAGAPVVRVAQMEDKEIVIAIPENQVDSLRRVADIQVRIWANPNAIIPGTLRELSPMADPATRTYAAKIAIPKAPDDVRLGMTAYVRFATKSPTTAIRVPLTAVFPDKGGTAVWVVENGVVRLVPVQVAGPSADAIMIASGLTPGQTVVTAGVNSLKPGQKVTILGEDPAAATATATATATGGATPAAVVPAAATAAVAGGAAK